MEDEIAALRARYGRPREVQVTLRVANLFSAINARPTRVAEVVLVIQRPDGRLLTLSKAMYPPGIYRLPSGSVNQGEGIEAALWREVAEETGLQTEIARFLAIIHYRLLTPEGERTFVSYIFLLRETGGELQTTDQEEQVSAVREIEWQELPALAKTLEAIKEHPDPEIARWGDWGRFRAIAHRVVWEELGRISSYATNCTNVEYRL